MKSNEKDPYNFQKIDGFLKERKETIGEKKQQYGKIYVKRQNRNNGIQNEGDVK